MLHNIDAVLDVDIVRPRRSLLRGGGGGGGGSVSRRALLLNAPQCRSVPVVRVCRA